MLCALVRCIVISAHCHSNRGIMVNHLIHELRTGIALQYGITQWFTLIIIETDNIMLLKSFIGYTKLLINRLLFNTQLFIYLSFWNCDSLTFFIKHSFHPVKKLRNSFFIFIGASILINLHLQGFTSLRGSLVISQPCGAILGNVMVFNRG